MKKVLVIGAAGFVGPYLVDNLISHGYEVLGTKLANQEKNFNSKSVDLNILNKNEVNDVLSQFKPDYIVHLAAQSSVKLSWANPQLTFEINVIGVINLLETIHSLNLKTRTLLIGSSEEYGKVQHSKVSEEHTSNPTNFYALSKITQEKIGFIYAKAYGLDVLATRSFNHIGAGQSPLFVASDFAHQIAQIERSQKEGVINVGNLNARRDFTSVKDVVNAYRLLLEKGKSNEIYNVGSGESVAISEILNKLIAMSNAKIEVNIDKNKFRPIDTPEIKADIVKLQEDTGFKIEHNIDETLREVLDYFRNNEE